VWVVVALGVCGCGWWRPGWGWVRGQAQVWAVALGGKELWRAWSAVRGVHAKGQMQRRARQAGRSWQPGGGGQAAAAAHHVAGVQDVRARGRHREPDCAVVRHLQHHHGATFTRAVCQAPRHMAAPWPCCSAARTGAGLLGTGTCTAWGPGHVAQSRRDRRAQPQWPTARTAATQRAPSCHPARAPGCHPPRAAASWTVGWPRWARPAARPRCC
jgi:hypothetical protein